MLRQLATQHECCLVRACQLLFCVLVPLAGSISPAAAETLLSQEATYTVRSYAQCWANHAVPGTGQWVDESGFYETPYMARQESGRTLIDGLKEHPSVLSTWFWNAEQKCLTVEFDLQRSARIDRVAVFLNDESQGAQADKVEVSVKREEEWELYASSHVQPDKQSSLHQVALTGEASGRFVRIQLSSTRSPIFSVSEIEIWGKPRGDLPQDAPAGFVATWPARDIKALTRAPDVPDTATLRLSRQRPLLAGELEPGQTNPAVLIDGDPETFLTSAKSPVTITVPLAGPTLLDRVVVWVVPEAPGGSAHLNIFHLALGPTVEGPFTPLMQRTQNTIYPGELKQPYRVWSPDLNGVRTSAVRLEAIFWPLNAPYMRLGEIEVWGRPATGQVSAPQPAWKVIKQTVDLPPEPLGKPEPQYDWILTQKVRGGYTGFNNFSLELLDQCKRHGLNTLVVHIYGDAMKGENFASELAQWGAACREHDLHFIPEISFGSDAVYGNTQFGSFHSGDATKWTRTPCPQAKGYWEKVVAERTLAAARIGTKDGVDGFCLDMEMYSADQTVYPGPCFCDRCFADFLKEFVSGLSAAQVPPETRLAWAKVNGLADLVARRQEREIQRLCTDIQRRVHEIDPHLILGTLLHPEALAGISRGFGTPVRPILVFEERTYWGNVSRIESVRRDMEASYPSLYVPGFWFQPVKPDRLPALSKVAAMQAHGYWYYTLYSLGRDQEKVPTAYRLPQPWTVDDYWKAISEARQETDQALAEVQNAEVQ